MWPDLWNETTVKTPQKQFCIHTVAIYGQLIVFWIHKDIPKYELYVTVFHRLYIHMCSQYDDYTARVSGNSFVLTLFTYYYVVGL